MESQTVGHDWATGRQQRLHGSVSHSVVSDSATPWTVTHQAPLPWDSPGKNIGVSFHFLLQGIFLSQEFNPCLLISRQILDHWATREAPSLPKQCQPNTLSCLFLSSGPNPPHLWVPETCPSWIQGIQSVDSEAREIYRYRFIDLEIYREITKQLRK